MKYICLTCSDVSGYTISVLHYITIKVLHQLTSLIDNEIFDRVEFHWDVLAIIERSIKKCINVDLI